MVNLSYMSECVKGAQRLVLQLRPRFSDSPFVEKGFKVPDNVHPESFCFSVSFTPMNVDFEYYGDDQTHEVSKVSISFVPDPLVRCVETILVGVDGKLVHDSMRRHDLIQSQDFPHLMEYLATLGDYLANEDEE